MFVPSLINKSKTVFFSLALLLAAGSLRADCVVLLHGLTRSSASMAALATAFSDAGYAVANIDYPSTRFPIEELAAEAIERGIEACPVASTVHFVTHSLGGILVRYYFAHKQVARLGRVVMLAPPNQGSGVVAAMHEMPGFAWYNGPAGLQLGTDAQSIPLQLPAVTYPVGIIAGTKTFNLILSHYQEKFSYENFKKILIKINSRKVNLTYLKFSGEISRLQPKNIFLIYQVEKICVDPILGGVAIAY